MADLKQLSSFADGLLANLTSSARSKLARQIAKTLQKSQQQRIADQLNPDGSSFTPRKPQLRGKNGRVRRSLFAKMRTPRYLKTQASSSSAGVVFIGQVQRIAQVHQFGLRDRVRPGGAEVQYPTRELLGFSDEDLSRIEDQILDQLSA